MLYCTIVALMLLPAPGAALVDCLGACSRCARWAEHPGLLEVYCAMCRECTDRRRHLRYQGGADGMDAAINVGDYPDCPTPPPCDPEPEEPPRHTLAQTVPRQPTTATTPTTTTTRRPCPPVTSCRPPRLPPPSPLCYYPCLYPCVCPYPGNRMAQSTTSSPTTSEPMSPKDASTGYMYVYVGVPKDVLRKKVK